MKRRQELRGEVGGVAGDRRLRAPPHGGARDDRRHPPPLSRTGGCGRSSSRAPTPAARNIHQDEYAHAFNGADEAIISQPSAIAKVPESERVDAKRMAEDIGKAGTRARWMESPDAIVAALAKEASSGDVVLAMSNGAFGGLHDKLLKALGP